MTATATQKVRIMTEPKPATLLVDAPVVAVEGLAVCPRCTHLLPDGPCDGCARGGDDLHVWDPRYG